MSIVLDGSNGVTFPNGSNPQAAPSKVLQVVNATTTTQIAITSGSASTGLTASITPLFSTSKVLLNISQQYHIGNSTSANCYGYFYVQRNGTTIYTGNTAEVQLSSGTELAGRWALTWLDSPASTSSTTYTVYFTVSSGNGTVINNYSIPASITLMEISQ